MDNVIKMLDQKAALGAYLDAMFIGDAPVPESQQQEKVAQWGDESFQVTLFKVVGLTLAVPMSRTKNILANDFEITPGANSSSLSPGTITAGGRQISVVDTASLVLQGKASGLNQSLNKRCSQFIIIDEGQWALACEDVGEMVALKNEDITWRGAGSKRLWLAGTARKHNCALLDIDVLISLLSDQMA